MQKARLAKAEFIVYNINNFQNNTGRQQFNKRLLQVVITVQRLLHVQLCCYNKTTAGYYG